MQNIVLYCWARCKAELKSLKKNLKVLTKWKEFWTRAKILSYTWDWETGPSTISMYQNWSCIIQKNININEAISQRIWRTWWLAKSKCKPMCTARDLTTHWKDITMATAVSKVHVQFFFPFRYIQHQHKRITILLSGFRGHWHNTSILALVFVLFPPFFISFLISFSFFFPRFSFSSFIILLFFPFSFLLFPHSFCFFSLFIGFILFKFLITRGGGCKAVSLTGQSMCIEYSGLSM